MVWLNIVAILILQKPALAALRDYERQRKAGKEPEFDPDALGIGNAEFWRERKRAAAAAEIASRRPVASAEVALEASSPTD